VGASIPAVHPHPPFQPGQLVVSVEHASHRVPAALADLGLPRKWFEGHHGWDPGAAAVGRMLARAFAAPLHLGRWSRLCADLNRSADHPRVVPAHLSHGGRRIPGNADLDAAGRAARLARYWLPYRRAVEADLDAAIARHGRVLHLSVHSFVERLGGQERRNHFGLLYDPAHRLERSLADRLDRRLDRAGFVVRRNYPYTGREDGFCMRMRAERSWDRYLGMEIELNQRAVRRPEGVRRLGRALVEALRVEVEARPARGRP
jgi:predicted N-formylglutamate amidohydrolase